MKSKGKVANYLDKIPQRNQSIEWTVDDSGAVTLQIVNKGVFNRIAQLLFKKPKISYVHLDEMGSFVWPLIDAKSSIAELGRAVDEQFGEQAHPLYERLAQFFRILSSYGFVEFI